MISRGKAEGEGYVRRESSDCEPKSKVEGGDYFTGNAISPKRGDLGAQRAELPAKCTLRLPSELGPPAADKREKQEILDGSDEIVEFMGGM